VGILEAGQDHPAAEVDRFRGGAPETNGPARRARKNDLAPRHGHGLSPGAGRILRIDRSVRQDQVGWRDRFLASAGGGPKNGHNEEKRQDQGPQFPRLSGGAG
jgi:hypothetical protein